MKQNTDIGRTNNFPLIYDHVINRLLPGLPAVLTYHNINHTLDVLEQAVRIAGEEAVTNEEDLYLLKTAALYHDTGFLYIYTGHEEKGCELGTKELPGFGFTHTQIEKICGIIMATKIPQSPQNKLQRIICDADLDYLGRNDFDPISNSLYKEFLVFGIVKNHDEWMRMQIRFLESHQYFTKSSQELRQAKKADKIASLKASFSPGN